MAQPGLENVVDAYPLSPLQQGMFFHVLADPTSGVFVHQMIIELSGELDVAKFRAAGERLVARHSSLRTLFLWEGLDEPLQVVRDSAALDWSFEDLTEIDTSERETRIELLLADDREKGFDLGRAPLTRMSVVRTEPDTWLWVWTTHHMIADGWSAQVMLDELFADYRTGVVPASEPLRYRDFIAGVVARDEADDEVFWRPRLAGFSSPHRLDAPGLPPGPDAVGYRTHTVELDAATSDAVRAYARHAKVTLNTAAMGAWGLLLAGWMRQTDVVFGATTSGRNVALSGIERGVGLFINTLPVRLRIEPERAVGEWLREVQQHQLEMGPFEQTSLASVQLWSEVPAGEALFESIFVFENMPDSSHREEGGGIAVETVDFQEHSNYPLAVLVHPDRKIRIRLVFDSARLSLAAAVSIGDQLAHLLGEMGGGGPRRLADLGVTPPGQVRVLREWEAGPPSLSDGRTVNEIIDSVAAGRPDAPAVVFAGRTTTYRELNEMANRIAWRLRAAGVEPDRLVGLYLDRSIEMVAGMLGILKAGGAYVPLDPAYPAAHIQRLLREDGIDIVLSSRSHAIPAEVTKVVVDGDGPAGEPVELEPVDPDSLAYVIYTSGSTGRPKGVMVSHRNLVASTLARDVHYQAPVGRFLLLSPFAFDSSVVGLFWTLFTGGTLVLPAPQEEQDLERILALAASEQVTHLLALPALYSLFLEHDPAALSSLLVAIVAGEACPPGLLESHQRLLPATQLHNEYGPTEATVWCSAHRARPGDAALPLPIGRPIAGTRIHLLDAAGNRVPIGFAGEMCVAGDGLARGYLNRPDLTAERFVTVGIDGQPERIYRTGDLGCFLPDGSIQFLGRADLQLKIRGHRIETSALESELRALPGVLQAAVAGRIPPGKSAAQLVAYVIAAGEFDGAALLRDLRARLPAFMVPDLVVPMADLPRLPNGKVNHAALPEPQLTVEDGDFVAPRTPTEQALAQIWSDILGVDRDRVGADSDFFDLGGHSLLAIRLASAVHRQFGLSLPLATLFETRRLGDLAEWLQRDEVVGASSLLVPIRSGGGPRVFFIHPGGGNVLVYEPVVRHLPEALAVTGIQAHGVAGEDEPDRTFTEMATRYAAEIVAAHPSGPVHLVGYSTGGLIAYEVARILEFQGRSVGLVALLDTVFPIGGSIGERTATQLRIMRDGGLGGLRTVFSWWWAALRAMAGRIRHAPRWTYLRRRGRALPPDLAGKRINHIALRAYRDYRPGPYGGTVTFIRAAGDGQRRYHGSISKWQSVARNLVVRNATGRHAGKGNMVTEPHAASVAAAIAEGMLEDPPTDGLSPDDRRAAEPAVTHRPGSA